MEPCSVKYALSVLQGKWKLYIMYVLSQTGEVRFNQLQREVGGISAVMLSKNLQELEENGLVTRSEVNDSVPHVEYSLTPLGARLTPALASLGDWGHEVWVANGGPQA